MKHLTWVLLLLLLMLIAACQPGEPSCPPEKIGYLTNSNQALVEMPQSNLMGNPEIVEINGREVQFDRVIKGTLCNDNWQGTVYVPCEIQIFEWGENPTFLESCELNIEPGTVVYVAAHNDEPYYQGCSCHTGEGEQQ
jgi:hypothetical protein